MKSHAPDYILLGATIILVVFGLVMLSSASMVKSQENFDQPYYYLRHQLLYGLLPGVLLAFATYKIDYKFWKKISFFVYLGALAMLTAVLIPGLGFQSGGAIRWLNLGPISFQPSELAKLGIIIYLAAWLQNKSAHVSDWKESFVPFLIITGLVAFLVGIQPNIGTAGLIVAVATAMFFVAGARLWHIGILAAIGSAALIVYVKMFSHAIERFQVFLNPEFDPQGIGYQINQALLAIGSGGIFGRGLGQSIQKYNYLPEPMGDSIFAIVAEELGFIRVIFLLLLFIALAVRGFQIAKRAPDDFAKYLSFGITFWLVFQSFINIGAICGLIPLTGIPLPFISYGGTSLIVTLTGVGILLNISKYANPKS